MSVDEVAVGFTLDERDHLAECETLIAAGLASFVEVGDALAQVRDSRLYRVDHDTFEDYCRERWGLTHRRINQLIAAGAVGTIVPVSNEAQARELAPLRDDPNAMSEAWREANERAEAEDRPVTAKDVRDAVRPAKQTSTTTRTDTTITEFDADSGEILAPPTDTPDAAPMLCPYCEQQPGQKLVNVPDAGWCCPDCDLDETDQVPNADTSDRPADALDARSSGEPAGGDSRTGGTRPSGPAPTARQTPLAATARNAGWDFRKATERVERVFADNRFPNHREQVAAQLRGHLTYAAEVIADLMTALDTDPTEDQ